MRKPLRACAAASLIAAFPIAAHAVAQVTQTTARTTTTTTTTSTGSTSSQLGFVTGPSSPAPAPAPAPTPPPTPAPTTTPPPAPAPETPVAVTNPTGARVVLEPVPVVDGISAYGERVPGSTTAVGTPAPATGAAAPSIDFAEIDLDHAVGRETRRAQRKVGRNEQRLYTIAPRTNVDRSAEMPDDPASPAISPPDRGRIQY